MLERQLIARLVACVVALSGCGDSKATDPGMLIRVGSAVDVNGDGAKDGVALDTDGDGVADGIDTDGDNTSDGPLPGSAVVVGDGASGGMNTGTGGDTTTGGVSNTTGGAVNTNAGDDGGANDAGNTTGLTGDNPDTLGDDAPGAVACGKGAACASGQKCCAFAAGSSTCKASCGFGDTEAICDGPEDCPIGQFCCSGIAKSYCGDDCTGSDFVGCHTLDDCKAGASECRENGVFEIWGVCD